jgi:hypothetical protein
MYKPHARPSKRIVCCLCSKKVRWAHDCVLIGRNGKRMAHRSCAAL